MSHSMMSTSEILGAARRGDLLSLRYAIELLNDEIFDISDEEGINCLHSACIGGELAAVQLLLYETPSDDSLKACELPLTCSASNKLLHREVPPFPASERPSGDPSPPSSNPQMECSDVTFAPEKSDSTSNSLIVECNLQDDSVHSSYTSTESDPRTVSSRVSTRSSDTIPFEPQQTAKGLLCPSCLVTRQSDSENCLKCGEILVQSDVTVLTLQPQKPSVWVNKVTKRGHTALHWAALKGYSSIVKELLFSGFDVNATTNQNATAMHLAAAKNHVECVKLLTRFKADLNIKTNTGSTPMWIAKKLGLDALSEVLEAYRVETDTHKKATVSGEILESMTEVSCNSSSS